MNRMHWNKSKTIGAKVISNSFNSLGQIPVIWTMELVYPHIIHAHLLTHRVFSRNTASSRAVPANIDIPLHHPIFKQNQAGMSPGELFGTEKQKRLSVYWADAYRSAKTYKDILAANNVHKQWCNRLTEPYELKKVIVTATEWDNFLWLRDHKDAQDEICELAQLIKQAQDESEINYVHKNQWHIPHFRAVGVGTYVNTTDTSDTKEYSTFEAMQISASAVAQVSYRKLDFSLDKAVRLWGIFASEDPKERPHGSVFEHIAHPMSDEEVRARSDAMDILRAAVANRFASELQLEKYVEKMMFANNFKGWNQLRDYML